MNIFDKAIGLVNPKAAWERAMFRQGLEQLRNYNASKVDRLQPWVPVNASPEQTDGPHRDILKARARDLERNSDMAEAAIGAITRNVVGTGIKPQAKVKKADGTADEKANDRLEELWKIWAKAENCDVTRLSTFYELQDTMLRRRIVDGEIFCKKITDKSSMIPFRLQGVEADLLDSSLLQTPGGKNPVISGVEVNEHFQAPRILVFAFYSRWFYESRVPEGSCRSRDSPIQEIKIQSNSWHLRVGQGNSPYERNRRISGCGACGC